MQLTKVIKETFYIPNDPDKGYVEIKHLKINEVKEITSNIADMYYTTNQQTGEVTSRLDPNSYALTRAMAHAAVLGWGNMKDVIGNSMLFTPANLNEASEFEVTLTIKDVEVKFDFYGWIDRCRKELSDKVEEQKVLAAENL